jgi:hypothetical protein
MSTLLIGLESSQSTEKTIESGKAAAFAVTASETGLLEELILETGATTNTCTSVKLGIFGEEPSVTNGTTHTSKLITGISSTSGMLVGDFVKASNIPSGTTITLVKSSTELEISQAATTSTTVSLSIGPWRPVACVQEGTYSGAPAINSTFSVSGFVVPVLKNSPNYFLVVSPIGGTLHIKIHGSGGTTRWRQTSEVKSNLYELISSSWGSGSGEGPVHFIGKGKAAVGTERKIMFGIDAGDESPANVNNHHTSWVTSNVIIGRGIDNTYTVTPSIIVNEVKEALEVSIKPIVIIDTSQEIVLHSITPSTYAEKAFEIIKAIEEAYPNKVAGYEIINEPWEKGPHKLSNAADYGNIVKSTIEKVRIEGYSTVPLLIASRGNYEKAKENGESTGEISAIASGAGWISDMFSAQSSLKSGGSNEVKIWTAHPYGRAYEIESYNDSGFLSLVAIRSSISRLGGNSSSMWITECGFDITGSSSGRNVINEAEQSEQLELFLNLSQIYGEANALKVLVVYADNAETWNIYGKTAGTMYQNFAKSYGLSVAEEISPILEMMM